MDRKVFALVLALALLIGGIATASHNPGSSYFSGARILRNTTTSITAGQYTTLDTYTTTSYAMGDVSANASTGKLTVSKAGYYRISAYVAWDGTNTISNFLIVLKNGSSVWQMQGLQSNGYVFSQQGSDVFYLAANDYIQVQVVCSSPGGSITAAYLSVVREG